MKLELYVMEHCPYCVKVRRYINDQGIQSRFTTYDINEDEAAMDRLLKMNDDEQVPCLVIDGKPMLESADIIEWLKTNVQKS